MAYADALLASLLLVTVTGVIRGALADAEFV